MQATVDNRDIPVTIRPVPQVRGVSRGRQVPDGIVGRAPRFEKHHVKSQIYESARTLRLHTRQDTRKGVDSAATSPGLDCDVESNETNRPDAPARSRRRPSASIANASRKGESKTSTYDDGLAAFLSVRPRLFGIAYRMLRSAEEAEDIVQDVWLRWQTADRSMVRDSAAFLVTTATRLAINVVQSARSRRETHAAPWLPERVDTGDDPGWGAERREALELGVLLLLERLSPAERAAYILREAFDYAYRDIANILRFEEANVRQVVTRARQHVANGRRIPASTIEQRRLLDSFIAAAQRGDVAALEGLLASDVVSISARAAAA